MIEKFRYNQGQFEIKLNLFILTGSDTKTFLQKQSTFNIDLINKNEFHLISFLDPQGKLETYGWLICRGEDYYLLTPLKQQKTSWERLNRFLISEDVNIEDCGARNWWFVLGPLANPNGYKGQIFGETSYLLETCSENVPSIGPEDLDLWRAMSGWPDFNEELNKELITGTPFYDISVSQNKGCYPGQETVLKITTRRGAAQARVLLESKTPIEIGNVEIFGKIVGKIHKQYFWSENYYLEASILRDFRVQNADVFFKVNNKEFQAKVKYPPIWGASNQEKSQELFFAAMEEFKKDNLEEAENLLKLSLRINEKNSDAVESYGVLLGRLNRFEEAIAQMQKLVEIDQANVLAHTNMSLFLMKLGKIQEAEDQKSLATVKSFQKFGEDHKNKELEVEKTKLKEMDWERRKKMFLQVLEIDQEDVLANYGLGSIAVEKENWNEANEYLAKVITVDPNYAVAYLALGKVLKALGKYEEAKDTWTKGIKIAASRGELMPANQMQNELNYLP